MATLLKFALNQDVRRLHVVLLNSVVYRVYCVELLSDFLLLAYSISVNMSTWAKFGMRLYWLEYRVKITKSIN
jgi:hypothetical protein